MVDMHRPGIRIVLALGLGLALAVLATGCVRRSSAATELRFEWRAGEGFAGQVSFHQAPQDEPQGETRVFQAGQDPRVGPSLPRGVLHSEVGAVTKIFVVVRNPTDQPIRFWTAPHLPLPYSAERGLLIHCLCTGQQYEVPPGGTWTRVIEAGLNPQAGTRGPVVITHVFVAGDVPAPD